MDFYKQRRIELNVANLSVQDLTKILSLQGSRLKLSAFEIAQLVELGDLGREPMNRVLGLVNDYASYQDAVFRAKERIHRSLHNLTEGIATNINVPSLVSRLSEGTCMFILAASQWRSCQQSPQQISVAFDNCINSFFEELHKLSKNFFHAVRRIEKGNFGEVSVMDVCILLSGGHSIVEIESIVLNLFGRPRATADWVTKSSVISKIQSFIAFEKSIDAFFANAPSFVNGPVNDQCVSLRLPFLSTFSGSDFPWFSSNMHLYYSVKPVLCSLTKYAGSIERTKVSNAVSLRHIDWVKVASPSMTTAEVPEAPFAAYRAQIKACSPKRKSATALKSPKAAAQANQLPHNSSSATLFSASTINAGLTATSPSSSSRGNAASTSGSNGICVTVSSEQCSPSKMAPLARSNAPSTTRSNNSRRVRSASNGMKRTPKVDHSLLSPVSMSKNLARQAKELFVVHTQEKSMTSLTPVSIHVQEELMEQQHHGEVEHINVSHNWQDERDLGSVNTAHSALTESTFLSPVVVQETTAPAHSYPQSALESLRKQSSKSKLVDDHTMGGSGSEADGVSGGSYTPPPKTSSPHQHRLYGARSSITREKLPRQASAIEVTDIEQPLDQKIVSDPNETCTSDVNDKQFHKSPLHLPRKQRNSSVQEASQNCKKAASAGISSNKSKTTAPLKRGGTCLSVHPKLVESLVDSRSKTDFQYCQNQRNRQSNNIHDTGAVVSMPQGFTCRSMDLLGRYATLLRPYHAKDCDEIVGKDELSVVDMASATLVHWWRRKYPKKLLSRRLEVRANVVQIVLDMAARAIFISGRRQQSHIWLAREGAAVTVQRLYRFYMVRKVRKVKVIQKRWKRYRARLLLNIWATCTLSMVVVYRYLHRLLTKRSRVNVSQNFSFSAFGAAFIRLKHLSILNRRYCTISHNLSLMEMIRKRDALVDQVRIYDSAVLIQKRGRMIIARHAVFKITYLRHRLFESMVTAVHRFRFLRQRPKITAAVTIQRFTRGCIVRKILFQRIQASQIIGRAVRKHISKVRLKVEVRRKEKPLSLVLHDLNNIPKDMFSNNEVQIKVSVWWSQLLHIVSSSDFSSIVATKKANMVFYTGACRISSEGRSSVPQNSSEFVDNQVGPGREGRTSMPPVAEADEDMSGTTINAPGSVTSDLKVTNNTVPISRSANSTERDDDQFDVNAVSSVKGAKNVGLIATNAARKSIYSIDEAPQASQSMETFLAKELDATVQKNIQSDWNNKSTTSSCHQDNDFVSKNRDDEKILPESLERTGGPPMGMLTKAISFFGGAESDDDSSPDNSNTPASRGKLRKKSSFAMKLKQTFANPAAWIADRATLRGRNTDAALIPKTYWCNFKDELFNIPLCHGNSVIRFEFLEPSSTRKVATYTYFMSRHGKVLFQDGEMEGYVKLNLNAQNRLEQRDGQHTPLFKFTTGSGLRSNWVYVRVRGIGPGKLALQQEAGIGVSLFSEWRKILLSLDGNGYVGWFSARNESKPFYKFPMSDITSLQIVPGFTLTDSKNHDTQNVVVTNTLGDTVIFRFREKRDRKVWETLFKDYVNVEAHDPMSSFGKVQSKVAGWVHTMAASLPVDITADTAATNGIIAIEVDDDNEEEVGTKRKNSNLRGPLVRKHNVKAVIRNDFEVYLKFESSDVYVRFVHYKVDLALGTSRSTTNMFHHFKNQHSKMYRIGLEKDAAGKLNTSSTTSLSPRTSTMLDFVPCLTYRALQRYNQLEHWKGETVLAYADRFKLAIGNIESPMCSPKIRDLWVSAS